MSSKRHALTFVTITVFIDTMGFGVIMPVMPEFLMSLTGKDLSHASAISGYLVVFYAALQFMFAPIIGNLSDRYGRRPVLLLSLFTYAVNYLIAGLAPNARAAQVIGMVVLYPMLFLSGAGIPLEVMPDSVRTISDYLPLTYVVRLLRGLWFGEPWGSLLLETSVLLGVLVTCTAIAVRLFRWE